MFDNNDSDDEDSLKIVLESPEEKILKTPNKRCIMQAEPSSSRKRVCRKLEKKFEYDNTRKNVKTKDVKWILKQVLKNEHVLALVRQIINPEQLEKCLSSEAKLTRSKTKQLLSGQNPPPLHWFNKPSTSSPTEIQSLIAEDLQEDSSGDEYIPGVDEGQSDEDDFESEPSTPKSIDNATQTSWTDDGLFKVPSSTTKHNCENEEEKLNIALRTRSKLSLSSTPLEVFEEALIPPDITTDMYDLECDDDEWKDFLKMFARPIDEVVGKPAEDDDHDPEYNVLAEEDIFDKEELRADEDAQVSQEELNELLVELLGEELKESENEIEQLATPTLEQPLATPAPTAIETNNAFSNLLNKQSLTTTDFNEEITEEEAFENEIMIEEEQKAIFKQQMRMHIQLLTQNYIQTYKHPEFQNMAAIFHEYLVNFHNLGLAKQDSHFHASNLKGALKLINDWTIKIDSNDEDVKAMTQELEESTNNWTFIFPKLMLNTLSNSDVLIYPKLLPEVPFLPKHLLTLTSDYILTTHEDNLIAVGMEQFYPYLKSDPKHVHRNGELKITSLAKCIVQYLMPFRRTLVIAKHITTSRNVKKSANPIRFFFENNHKAPVTVHDIINLDTYGILPPCQRNPEELSTVWKKYLYEKPDEIAEIVEEKQTEQIKKIVNKTNNNKYLVPFKKRKLLRKKYRALTANNSSFSKRTKTKRYKIIVKPDSCECKLERQFKCDKIILNIESDIKELKFNTSILKKHREHNMPFLNINNKNSDSGGDVVVGQQETEKKSVETESIISENEKDNLEDINALMIASSTINNQNRRRVSAAEKKRKKIRKDFTANLSLIFPEDPQDERENANNFAQAFYDKIQERLDVTDCNKFMQILSDYEADKSPMELFRNIDNILKENYPDLSEEFLAFLTPQQAYNLGKIVPYFMLTNMTLFLRKLEIHFKEQPSQVQKIYRSLNELSDCVNLTMDRIKLTILPLLRGNKLLTEWFLQLFPIEKPPNCLLNGPNDTLNMTTSGFEDNNFETIFVPDVEDPYGGPNCICTCHTSYDDEGFKTRNRHCIPCGTKFLQGRVYVQTGKGLRLAKITFNTPKAEEHYKRLGCCSNSSCGTQTVTSKKRSSSDSSPSKLAVTSPTKETHPEEGRSLSSDDDGDCRRKLRALKSPRKRKLCQNDANKTKVTPNTGTTTLENDKHAQKSLPMLVVKTPTKEDEPAKIQNQTGEQLDCDPTIETMDLRLSPECDNISAPESGSEFCEESSQDNNSSDGCCVEEYSPVQSETSNGSPPVSDGVSWTKEEDRIILQTFQKEGNSEETFKHVSEILENRSIEQIKIRFSRLINLLQEMAAASN